MGLIRALRRSCPGPLASTCTTMSIPRERNRIRSRVRPSGRRSNSRLPYFPWPPTPHRGLGATPPCGSTPEWWPRNRLLLAPFGPHWEHMPNVVRCPGQCRLRCGELPANPRFVSSSLHSLCDYCPALWDDLSEHLRPGWPFRESSLGERHTGLANVQSPSWSHAE